MEDRDDGALDSMTLMAPPGVVERRYVLAHALRLLRPRCRLTALAPKALGGSRLRSDLAAFGCAVDESARRHHRICRAAKPDFPVGLDPAIAAGGLQIPPALGLWSQPGIFSWDRPDPGTTLLLRHLPELAGAGADLGCGAGVLARAVLNARAVTRLALIDIDRRAIDAARRNIHDPRAEFCWRDLRICAAESERLDFVVMNPPFHQGGEENRAVAEAFMRRAAAMLRPGGVCWLVANRHLPYEAMLRQLFPSVRLVEQTNGYKVCEARR